MDISFDALYKHGDPRGNIRLENEDIVYVPKSRRAKIADVLAVVSPVTSLFWSYTTVKSAVSP
jgi:protein involved in polysaccharide export with SLBB domain